MTQPTVALVYDWVTVPHGGAERVLLALHEAFPEAPLFTSMATPSRVPWAAQFELHTSWLQRLPGLPHHHRWSAPLLPLAFESLNLDEYQVIISVTSAEAKGVLTRPDQLHLCYVLTPPRYLYTHTQEYQDYQLRHPFLQKAAQPLLNYLRWWDQAAAYRPDHLIPISRLVSQRVREYYSRSSLDPLYPPVREFSQDKVKKTKDHYLVVSRLVPYKRIDLAVEACLQLGRPLVIVGEGPDKERLQALAGDSQLIQFVGAQSDADVNNWLQTCRGLLMPGLEDFGITAAEAVAAGRPVVVHRQSGVAEILKDEVTAIFLEEETVPSLVNAMRKLEGTTFKPSQLRQSMRKYATTTFVQEWQRLVAEQWSLFQKKGLYER